MFSMKPADMKNTATSIIAVNCGRYKLHKSSGRKLQSQKSTKKFFREI